MPVSLPRPHRSIGRAVLRRWHHFYDLVRYKWRNFRATRKAMRCGGLVVQDHYDIRFIAYPWDRSRLEYLIARGGDVGEFSAIPRLVKPGDVAFDVGANV